MPLVDRGEVARELRKLTIKYGDRKRMDQEKRGGDLGYSIKLGKYIARNFISMGRSWSNGPKKLLALKH